MITGSRILQPAGGRERARKKHERKDETWPCWPLDLWMEEGWQNKSAGTVRGRKLIPPRCCASVERGVPDQPTGTADMKPPLLTAQFEVPLRGCLNGEGVGGLQVAVETLGTKSTRTQAGTMDTNPEILMPMVVAHWGWRQGCVGVYLRCSDRLPTHTPAAGQEGCCQKTFDRCLSSFSLCHHCCYYVCILAIHMGSLTLLAQVSTYTQKEMHTILPHQWSMDARQRKGGRCIHSLSIVHGSSVSPVNRQGSAW